MPKRPENAVADFRAQIESLKAERAAVRARPAAAGEAEARIDAFIAYQAERYRTRTPVERLRQRASLDTLGDIDDAALAFFFGDAIKTALMVETADGLNAGERDAELARLDSALLEAERGEEQAIVTSETNGQPITRRADADPRAVLEFE